MNGEKRNPVLQGKQVLVVDDDPMILRSLNLMLTQAGLQTRLVNNGAEALEQLKHSQPDIIILDYMMPGMTGAQVFDRILSEDDLRDARQTPVIMLTAKTDKYDEQRELFRKGLSAYLFKPFGQKELFNVLGNIVVLEAARKENERLSTENIAIKNFLQGVFDSITDIVSIQSEHFEVMRANKAADQASQYNGTTACFQRYFNQTEVCAGCPALKTLKNGRPESARLRFGETIFEVRTYPIIHGDTRAFVEIIKDVTTQQKMDEQLAESAKLASIGTLAAGVAHEINNPLSIILGCSQTLLSEETLPAPFEKDLSVIAHEAQRCGRIVRDLLDYARPSASQPLPVNLNELCQQAVGLVRHFLKKNSLALEEVYDGGSGAQILVDAKKITQVLINVLMNAIQATPAGGHLRIVTTAKGDVVDISITDTGAGIAEEDLTHIFEPFFTRKPGIGIGLGLAVSKAIVLEHQGSIDIRSRQGTGTTVMLRFPQHRQRY